MEKSGSRSLEKDYVSILGLPASDIAKGHCPEITLALGKFHQNAHQISRHPWQGKTERNYHAAPLQDSCSEVVCFGPIHSNRQRSERPVFLMEGV